MCKRHKSPLFPSPQNTPEGDSKFATKKFLNQSAFLSKWVGSSDRIKHCHDKFADLNGNYQIISRSPPAPVLSVSCNHFRLLTSRTFLLSKWAPTQWTSYQSVFILTPPIYFLNIYVLGKIQLWKPLPFLYHRPPPKMVLTNVLCLDLSVSPLPPTSEARTWAQLHPSNLKALFWSCKAATALSLRQAQNTALLAIPNLWKEAYVKQTRWWLTQPPPATFSLEREGSLSAAHLAVTQFY